MFKRGDGGVGAPARIAMRYRPMGLGEPLGHIHTICQEGKTHMV